MITLEPWFLEILACPRCRERVELTPGGDGLRCDRCAVVYPIEFACSRCGGRAELMSAGDELRCERCAAVSPARGGIPQMLPDSGRPVEPRDRS